MLRRTLLFSGFIIILACNSTKEKNVKSDHYLEPKGRLKAVIDSFVQVAGNKSKVYELYVIKHSPFEAELILYCGDTSLTKDENSAQGQVALEKTQAMGVTFDVYSGCERYFNRQGDPGRKKEIPMYEGNSWPDAMWVIRDSAGIFKVFSTKSAYPFIGIPDPMPDSIMTKFKPPVVPAGEEDK
jgi:hypothetical protein